MSCCVSARFSATSWRSASFWIHKFITLKFSLIACVCFSIMVFMRLSMISGVGWPICLMREQVSAPKFLRVLKTGSV